MADVPIPVSSTDVFDGQDFIQTLAKLIVSNLYVKSWVFKMNDEMNGRGTASINLDLIKPLQRLRRQNLPDQHESDEEYY